MALIFNCNPVILCAMKKSQLIKKLTALLLALSACVILTASDGSSAVGVDQLLLVQTAPITRAQFVMLLNDRLSLPEGVGAGFNDVPQSHPYAADILSAQAAGYINRDDNGNFRPDAVISGAEAAVFINFFLGFDLTRVPLNASSTAPQWAKPAVSNLLDLGMVTLALTEKKALTVADAEAFTTALTIALMFRGSPYELRQADEKDDFYAYNNRQYLATATIPPGELVAMAAMESQININNRLDSLLAGILAAGGNPGSDEWKISELYRMYMDESGRAKSIEKIRPIINEIKAVKNAAEFSAITAKYYPIISFQNFYEISAASDARVDAGKWCFFIEKGSLTLFSRDYYMDDPALAPIHEAVKNYMASVLGFIGETGDLEARATAMFAMEKGRALASLPQEQLSNPDVIYTKSSWQELDKITTASNVLNYNPGLREILKDANVYCPDIGYVKYIESLYTEANLAVLKDFAIYNAVCAVGGYIGDDFAELKKELDAILYGWAVETGLEQRARKFVTELMENAFSKLYAENYVSSDTKTDVTQMVELLRKKYRERIVSLNWMSGETKQKAIEKLDSIKAFIAYPDSYDNALSFDVKAKAGGGTLIDVYMNYADAKHKRLLECIQKPYESDPWDGTPTYTMNAFYSRVQNSIIVPAGILQEPMYSKDVGREVNWGGIGTIIGHEISHAFDNGGAQYDKNGTLTNWWTAADHAAFAALVDKTAAALSDIQFVNGKYLNGVRNVGETISDLGGLASVLDIIRDMNGDMALFMRSYAHLFAARMSAELAEYLLSSIHAPNKVRTNFVLSQFEEFYKTFGITRTDGMYIAPEKRTTIW